MSYKYFVIKKTEPVSNDDWMHISSACINSYLWDTNGYKPEVQVQLYRTDTNLYVRFTAYEDHITVRHFENNSPVYKDSCVELFLNPTPEKSQCYLNFEINAAGILLLALGTSRFDRRILQEVNHEIFDIKSSVSIDCVDSYSDKFWVIEYKIPFTFLAKYFEGFKLHEGLKMKSNFYNVVMKPNLSTLAHGTL